MHSIYFIRRCRYVLHLHSWFNNSHVHLYFALHGSILFSDTALRCFVWWYCFWFKIQWFTFTFIFCFAWQKFLLWCSTMFCVMILFLMRQHFVCLCSDTWFCMVAFCFPWWHLFFARQYFYLCSSLLFCMAMLYFKVTLCSAFYVVWLPFIFLPQHFVLYDRNSVLMKWRFVL